MKKSYRIVTNVERLQLITLIHIHGYSISEAAKRTGIFYPTAKAINRIFRSENRIEKKSTSSYQRRKRESARVSVKFNSWEELTLGKKKQSESSVLKTVDRSRDCMSLQR